MTGTGLWEKYLYQVRLPSKESVDIDYMYYLVANISYG